MKTLKAPRLHKRGLMVVIALVIAVGLILAYETFAISWDHKPNGGVSCYYYAYYGDYRDQQIKAEHIKPYDQKRIKSICKSHGYAGAVYRRTNGKWNKWRGPAWAGPTPSPR